MFARDLAQRRKNIVRNKGVFQDAVDDFVDTVGEVAEQVADSLKP